MFDAFQLVSFNIVKCILPKLEQFTAGINASICHALLKGKAALSHGAPENALQKFLILLMESVCQARACGLASSQMNKKIHFKKRKKKNEKGKQNQAPTTAPFSSPPKMGKQLLFHLHLTLGIFFLPFIVILTQGLHAQGRCSFLNEA